ncbi:zinc ABC transporter substrate-binding protein [Paenibacillus athensensis]|uniref:ABC transporter substrate-binding protein n=1 Tax=Paenibacillus athensensis TaxID=1967502 RepID=A0A4Y8Q268_9BACL|nr:metal ABC transporter substrate-binding protein [Paenibacillus athensensis]MCD1260657.1 zinc ABC transporter substrate-binding protein [Paenibacillus athensensis]
MKIATNQQQAGGAVPRAGFARVRGGVAALLGVWLVLAVMLSGCGSAERAQLVEGKINIVASFYPLYDFARNIGGEHVHAINLVPAGVEPHDWSPKSRDMTNMTKAQLFVYQGAGFEGWVGDFLDSLPKDSQLQVVEAGKNASLIRTADEAGSETAETADGTDAHDHDESLEYDPHAWLSPANARIMAGAIKDALVNADPAHQADYERNYAAYSAKLGELDTRFRQQLAALPKKEIAVSHQAFAYLCRDYGLTQMPIMGLSPDAEPTARDIQRMNAFIKAHDVQYIFFEELVSDKLAKTLAKDAGVGTMVLSPVEGLTEEEQAAGDDYISVMDRNLKNLMKALQ